MIELMVVVAIIGVLAAIGIPQYSKFQAKSRQSEAKLQLAALFTAEESFRQEWNQYTVNLVNIGFAVRGALLRYKTGFRSSSGCAGYSVGLGAPTETTDGAYTWSDGSQVNSSSATWSVAIPEPTAAIAPTSCTVGTFLGASYGAPGNTPVAPTNADGDTWTVNHTKLITNTQVNLGN